MIDGRLGARLTLGHSSTSDLGALAAAACAGCQSTRSPKPLPVSNPNGPAPAAGGANLKLKIVDRAMMACNSLILNDQPSTGDQNWV